MENHAQIMKSLGNAKKKADKKAKSQEYICKKDIGTVYII